MHNIDFTQDITRTENNYFSQNILDANMEHFKGQCKKIDLKFGTYKIKNNKNVTKLFW